MTSTLRMKSGLLAALCVSAASADSVSVSLVDSVPVSMSIPPSFASFSIEVPIAPLYLALPDGSARPSWANLMRVLQRETGEAGPNIRVGGGSSDTSAYIPAAQPLPPNITYRITDADFAAYAAAAPLWNGTVTVGTNFRNASNMDWAVAHVSALGAVIPWSSLLVEGVEVGNEVDVYADEGFRPAGYNGTTYAAEWGRFAAAMQAQGGLPPDRLQGAVFDFTAFFDVLDSYMRQYTSAALLRSISLHEYALGHCQGKTVTIWQLLNESAVYGRLAGMVPHIQAAQVLGLPLVIGEGNSASCGGQPGVSDVFAAALWAVDSFFAHAAAGIARWNAHGGGSGSIASYSPIGYPNASSSDDVPSVRPLYYGMWAFTAATRRYARVLNASLAFNPPAAAGYVSAWVVTDAAGETRVTIIHKDGNASAPATVTVVPPNPLTGAATLVRLVAAPGSGGIHASHNITFRGQTFDGSTDGLPLGPQVSENVPANAAGQYVFAVPPAGVALLILPAQ